MKQSRLRKKAAWCFAALSWAALHAGSARADWFRDETQLAWRAGDHIVWRFSFDPKFGKPFFNPVGVGDGPNLANFKPEDHPWHYGLWFSWKYINGANYWEEDRATGKPEGLTKWSAPTIETEPQGAAKIHLDLIYQHPSGRVDVTEHRDIAVSAPDATGTYTIDWRAEFKIGAAGALFDRTPMPGEPNGQVNGGYAGLSVRLAPPPLKMEMVSSTGAVEKFESGRARPAASAVAANFFGGANPVGSIAIFSDAENAGVNAPWYLINNGDFRFACAAILAPKPLKLEAGDTWVLHYRIVLRRAPWTARELSGK